MKVFIQGKRGSRFIILAHSAKKICCALETSKMHASELKLINQSRVYQPIVRYVMILLEKNP